VLEASHISWRSTSGFQRRYALELKCLAAAESLCGLVIRASCGQVCPLVMNAGVLGGHSHVIGAAPGSRRGRFQVAI
jgi:hypothetical protein